MGSVLVGVLFVAAIVVAGLQELGQWVQENPAEWVPWVAGGPPYLAGLLLVLRSMNRVDRSWGTVALGKLWDQWEFRLGLLLFAVGCAVILIPEYLLPLLGPPVVVPVVFPTPSPP